MHLTLTCPVDCICDFTYNFIWQHKGEELGPDAQVSDQVDSEYTYRQLVESLTSGEDVHISVSVGKRFASSLGVNLAYFGGFVDGNIGTRAGISMVSGSIAEPMGNIVDFLDSPSLYHYNIAKQLTDCINIIA